MDGTMTRRLTVSGAEELLYQYFPVLDHGYVALVDYMGGDPSLERAARVSYGSKTRGGAESRQLLRHLRRAKHTSPSEMCEVVLHCAMPIFIARQMIRHRTASVNEYSGRYSLMPMLFYTPDNAQTKRQSAGNKQGRAGEPLSFDEYKALVDSWNANRERTVEDYQSMTANGLAKELARIDLPLSTYTQWYWKIDLHNLLHFLTLRVDKHAQWEFQQYGRVIAGMVKRLAPDSYEAWIDYNVCAVTFSRAERMALGEMLRTGVDADVVLAAFSTHELTMRERDEFRAKLQPFERPDFELDLSTAKTGQYFEERYAAATLAGDR